MWCLVDLLSGRDGGSDHGEQLQSLHRVQGSQWDIQLQTQLNSTGLNSSIHNYTIAVWRTHICVFANLVCAIEVGVSSEPIQRKRMACMI